MANATEEVGVSTGEMPIERIWHTVLCFRRAARWASLLEAIGSDIDILTAPDDRQANGRT
jgi:hypothetical protein